MSEQNSRSTVKIILVVYDSAAETAALVQLVSESKDMVVLTMPVESSSPEDIQMLVQLMTQLIPAGLISVIVPKSMDVDQITDAFSPSRKIPILEYTPSKDGFSFRPRPAIRPLAPIRGENEENSLRPPITFPNRRRE